MSSTETTYSTFVYDWVVKSIPYTISYKKAFKTTTVDEIFCSIINEKGGLIEKSELGELLGFNLIEEDGKFKDIAEEAIFNDYLQQLLEFNLIEDDDELLLLTDLGRDSLINHLKYKFFYADVTLFKNVTTTGESFNFSFKDIFNLKSAINPTSLGNNKTLIKDINIKSILQYQVFESDIFNGEVIDIFESQSNFEYFKLKLTCHLITKSGEFLVDLSLNGEEKPLLVNLIYKESNQNILNDLIHKGKYQYTLNSEIQIDTKIINEFKDLWNWKNLAENKNVDWSDPEIFSIFKNNGDGSVWESISENAPIEIIRATIDNFIDYWNWRSLTKRFDNKYILNSIDKLKWDFEELSTKDSQFIILLLDKQQLKDENWDWKYLSANLPDNFIIDNINTFSWDFYLLTTNKFEVFKTVFNSDLTRQIENSWDWAYISEEINIKYLYKNISKFSSKINWKIVLNRFFNDEEILEKCISDSDFKQTLVKSLPEDFIISQQKYLWSIDVISFFDNLDLINWETTSYTLGFDVNNSVQWDRDIFDNFSEKISSAEGITNISALISETNLLFNNFDWDWVAISSNNSIISDKNFISKIITQPSSLINKLIWSDIYPLHEIRFWNEHLIDFNRNVDSELNQSFWNIITQDENIDYILSNYDFSWDWTYLTEICSLDIIISSKVDENLIQKWDWKIATTKFDKESILEHLEEFTQFWDWEFILKEVFSIREELKIVDGELARIASCLSILNPERKQPLWMLLTSLFPIELLFNNIEITANIDVFEWDWDTISAQKHLPTDLVSLYKLKDKLNWSILSENYSVKKQFSYENWGANRKGCFDNIETYLKQFKSKWDWNILSQNHDLNGDRRLLRVFKKEEWDWNYLSEFGRFLIQGKRDKPDYLIRLLSQFPKINFGLLSNREDIVITSEVILSKQYKGWDWATLSKNLKAEITTELLIELGNKNWDWKSISERRDIRLDNQIILDLINKDWNWYYLSSHPHLSFNSDFISQVKLKPWDWKVVSHQSSFIPSIEILSQTKNFDLDWTNLSERIDLNPTKELLAKFEDKWDWHYITRQSNIDFKDTELLLRFIDKWDWSYLSKEVELILNKETLATFKNHLDWNLISSNTYIDFTEKLIKDYEPYWNWSILKSNHKILDFLGDFVQKTIETSPILTFLDKIDKQHSKWSGSIYHFAHIENAIEIIKDRKIQCRNLANIKADSAGNVVDRRNDAHDYARFYFRPHTPTQFYNEFLGKDVNDGYRNKSTDTWFSWYERARGLGYPKCPIPIFFRFSIKEVLFKREGSCLISDGNMQTNATSFGPIESIIDKFGFDDLFYTPEQYANKDDYNRYRDYSQQELLIKNELSFSDLIDFEIICPSDNDRNLLINLIGNEHKEIFDKITVNRRYYNNENPRINVLVEEDELNIRSEFKGDGYLSVYTNTRIKPSIINKGDVERITGDKIIFKSNLSLNKYLDGFKLTFTDESKREWLIYQII